jgi:hypothetical protein
MVTPYLSRLRPAGPGLRPRPRSRFEPAPILPVDGPAIASLGLSLPPAGVAEAGEAEAEWDSPDRHAADPVTAAISGRELPPARTAAPEAAAPPGEPGAAPDARTARPPRPDHPPATVPAPGVQPLTPARSAAHEAAAPDGESAPGARTARPSRPDHVPAATPAPGGHSLTAARTAAPAAATPGQERPLSAAAMTASPPRPAPGPAIGGNTQRPAGNAADSGPASAGPAGRSGTAITPSRPEPLPPEGSSPAPRHVERPGQPADAPADRVQTMARWLRDADIAAGPAAGTPGPPSGPQPARPGGAPGWPDQAAHPDVTVTIGRIEVTAPVPEPAPARAPERARPGEPQRRVPSLDDYLASRARTRGRPG